METFHNIVDGKAVAAADGRTLDIVDPSTGEVYATSPLSGPDDVDTAFRSAAPPTAATGARPRRRTG